MLKIRDSLILLALAPLASCSEEKPLETIPDYEVPFIQERPVQTYTYISYPEHNILTHRFFSFKTKDGFNRTQKIHFNGREQWNRTYAHKGNTKDLVEEQWEDDSPETGTFETLEGKIKSYAGIDNGRKYQALHCKVSFTNKNGFRTTFIEDDYYLGDTTLHWKGQPIHTLCFISKLEKKVAIKYFPFFSRSTKNSSKIYCARGVGLIRMENDDGSYWELLTIE